MTPDEAREAVAAAEADLSAATDAYRDALAALEAVNDDPRPVWRPPALCGPSNRVRCNSAAWCGRVLRCTRHTGA